MSVAELTILLPLAALCLWLTIFLFTLVDHLVYRETYGHFLLGLDAIERQAGGRHVGIAAMTRQVGAAKTRYLARFVSNAASRRLPARLAAEEYVARVGESTLLARASLSATRWRATRLVALYALSRVSHPAMLPVLEQALGDEEPVLAYAALDMLDIHGSRGAAEVLLRALEGGVLPASRIATQLEHFRIDLKPLYIDWLEGDHPKSRYWIAYLLGKSGYSEATAALLEGLLSDSAADVRKIALSALSDLQAPGLQAHAETMLGDSVFFVRTLAARILARFPNPQAVRALASRLADENDAVQLAVKRSLVELAAVTLEHLPAADGAPDAATRASIAEITGSVLHARESAGAPGIPPRGEGTPHVR